MIIEARQTYAFLELKVNEIETTIFNSDEGEIDETINNLTEILERLYDMKGMHVEIRTAKL